MDANALHSAAQDMPLTDQDYTGLVWKAEETPRLYQAVYCAWGSETKEDRDVKKKEGSEWLARAGERVRVSFPHGKVICKGIVPKSVTKGKMQSGEGDQKMEEQDGMEVGIENKLRECWRWCGGGGEKKKKEVEL